MVLYFQILWPLYLAATRRGYWCGRFALYQYPRLFLVFCVPRFVLQLAFFHQRDADEQEEAGHRDGTNHIPEMICETIDRNVHDPNAPPHRDFTEVVGVTTVFP